MEQSLTIPDWNADIDVAHLDLEGLLTQATVMRRSVGRLLAEAGWPIVKLLPRNWNMPAEYNGQQFRYVVKSATPLDEEDENRNSDLLWLTASTDAIDLESDLIALPALKKIKQASVGQTIFLGHRYRVPKDVAGVVKESRLTRKEIFHPLLNKSATFNCVELGVQPIPKKLNKGGYKACQMALQGAARIGASVTVLSTNRDESRKPLIVHNDCIPLETSLVGLPCNLTAWAQPAKRKGMIAVPELPLPENAASQAVNGASAAPQINNRAADLRPETQELPNMADANTPTAEVMTQTLTEPSTKSSASELLIRGYFTDAYENRTSSVWFLTDLLAGALDSILWRTNSHYANNRLTGEEAVTEMGVALDEFRTKVLEKLTPKLNGEDDPVSKNADAAMASLADPVARIELNDYLSPVPLAKALLLKAGKRNSASDATLIQQMHDTCVELEAKCAMQKSTEAALSNGASVNQGSEVETLQKAHAAEKDNLQAENTKLQKALQTALVVADQAMTELETERRETKRWEARSLAAMAVLEEFELQPLLPGA